MIFLPKITPGAADRSYGIHVAELAGLPRGVISRAHEILRTLESSVNVRQREPDLFTAAPENTASPYENILVQLRSMDVNAVTPLEALQLLADLKEKLEKEGKSVYLFLTDEINVNQLPNFNFIEVWVNTACPGLDLDSNKIINMEKL